MKRTMNKANPPRSLVCWSLSTLWLLIFLVGCADNKTASNLPAAQCPKATICPSDAGVVHGYEGLPLYGGMRSELVGLEGANRIEADNEHVYGIVKHMAPATLARIPVKGGEQETLLTLEEKQIFTHLLIDDTAICLAASTISVDGAPTTILYLPKSAGAETKVIATPKGTVDGLTSDAEHIYYGVWKDSRHHEVFAVEKDTGKVSRIHHNKRESSDSIGPFKSSLSVDGHRVLWAYQGGGMAYVMGISKDGGANGLVGWGALEVYELATAGKGFVLHTDGMLRSYKFDRDSTVDVGDLQLNGGDFAVAGSEVFATVRGGLWYFPDFPGALLSYDVEEGGRHVWAKDIDPLDVAANDTAVFVLDAESGLLRFERGQQP